MPTILAIVATLILTGCSDVVTSRFATLRDAQDQHAFERGWLPPVMPSSDKKIVESNNLDVNTGSGSFVYDLAEWSAYLLRLQQAGASLTEKQESTVVILTTNKSRWEIELPQGTGQARYKTKQVPNQAAGANVGERRSAAYSNGRPVAALPTMAQLFR
jgi:hypothetical protein